VKQCTKSSIAFLVVVLALSAPRISRAQSSEDALIKGTADFVLDRAYDNYMYILQLKIVANPLLTEYFPETLRTAQAGDLRFLLTHKDLWKNAIEQDLKKLGEEGESKVSEKIIPVVRGMCDLAKKSAQPSKSTNTLCESLGKQGELSGEVTALMAGLVKAKKDPLAKAAPLQPPVISFGPAWMAYLGARDETERIALAGQVVVELLDGVGRVRAACENVQPGAYTKCVVELSGLFKKAARAEYALFCRSVDLGVACPGSLRKLSMYYEDEQFSDFLQYALFFAQMADADDPSTVKALLKSMTVPSVSFGVKREPFRTRFLISSYLGGGVASGYPIQKSHTEYFLAAPIGVEISQGRYSGSSLSILLSPIDLGYPLRLKLNDNNKTVRFSDIVVPGAYVFYGFREYPVAVGIGYARVRDTESPDKRVGRINLLMAFDMPLFTLH